MPYLTDTWPYDLGYTYIPIKMKRTNLVQPHASLKGIWGLFFEIGFYTPRLIKQEAVELSFVNTPADNRWKNATR